MLNNKRRNNRGRNSAENKMIRSLDDLEAFETFREGILPRLQKMLKDGADDEEILKWASSFAAARLASIVVADPDSGRAIAAIKDILDRTRGKAKESKNIVHRMAALPDNDLDALLVSEMAALEALDVSEEDSDDSDD